MSETNELLPCPWCGVEPALIRQDCSDYYAARCITAGCVAYGTSAHARGRSSAIARWNTRAPSPETEQLRARVAELEAALRPEAVEAYIAELRWAPDAPDVWRTLVAGNIRGFAAALSALDSALDSEIAAAVRAEREACAESAAAAPIRCAHVTCHACRNPAGDAIRARGEDTHAASCRAITGAVNAGYCVACRREATDRERGMGEPFCACGRRTSDCDGSRSGCRKPPSIQSRGES